MSGRHLGCFWTANLRAGLEHSNGIHKQFQRSESEDRLYPALNNGGLNGEFVRSTGSITLNGVRIFDPHVSNPRVRVLELPVRLLANNQLAVELRGTAGSGISLQIISLDFGPPSISEPSAQRRMRPAGTTRM